MSLAEAETKKPPIPFDTTWVMQALGMANYAPEGQYTVDVNKQQRRICKNIPCCKSKRKKKLARLCEYPDFTTRAVSP